jgi:hypothetical protein
MEIIDHGLLIARLTSNCSPSHLHSNIDAFNRSFKRAYDQIFDSRQVDFLVQTYNQFIHRLQNVDDKRWETVCRFRIEQLDKKRYSVTK